MCVPNDDIEQIYSDLIDTVEERERRLEQDILHGESFGVHTSLERSLQAWKEGRKSLRTLPVIQAYEAVLNDPVADTVKRTLTGLDATINVLDDIIDTRTLEKPEKIELTANVAFAGMLAFTNIPAHYQDRAVDTITQYLTELFQIPLVENRTVTTIQNTTSVDEIVQAASRCYAYRARDIDAFATLPGILHEVDDERRTQLVDDLRVYRAHELIYKDIADVPIDLRDADLTPTIAIMEQSSDPSIVERCLIRIHDQFTYSTASQGVYRQELLSLEREPDDLTKRIVEQMDVVAQHGSVQ